MPKPDNSSPDLVQIGQIVGAFGLRGQLKIQSITNIDERFDVGETVILKGEPKKILDSRIHKNRYLIKLEGITRLEHAEPLQWEYLYIPKGDRPELIEDEFMTEDLIGLKVVTEAGEDLGVVNDVMVYPAQDILVVGEHMIPAVKEFVEDIDLDKGILTVRLIEGI